MEAPGANKIINSCGFYVAGVGGHTLSELVDDAVDMIGQST